MVDEAPVIIMLALLALISLGCVVVYGVCVLWAQAADRLRPKAPEFPMQCDVNEPFHFL